MSRVCLYSPKDCKGAVTDSVLFMHMPFNSDVKEVVIAHVDDGLPLHLPSLCYELAFLLLL